MVIIDTSVWIDVLRGVENTQTAWFRGNLGFQPMGLTNLILCDVLQGTNYDSDLIGATSRLNRFQIYNTGGSQLSVDTARNYRYLRARGITIRKTIDCFIATFCIQNDHALLHGDRDFDHFEQHLGLKVVKH